MLSLKAYLRASAKKGDKTDSTAKQYPNKGAMSYQKTLYKLSSHEIPIIKATLEQAELILAQCPQYKKQCY